MRTRSFKYFACDFETTVYEGQDSTEVWAAASVELFTEDVNIFHSIGEQFDYFVSLNENIIAYYHHLKFDGSFWLSYLLCDLNYKQAYKQRSEAELDVEWLPDWKMPNKSFKYLISDMGQWYSITIKINDNIIRIYDSLKLLPFSVRRIGESFKTKHQKLDMEYKGLRYAGCQITDEEQKYIANDVLVIKEGLEIMFTEGHNKLTIGSCCLAEYKRIVGGKVYESNFPQLTDINIDPAVYGADNADEYIRKAYKGGWCYLVKGKENQVKVNGTTADVNSLYPSMMSSESGNRYPVGEPTFWSGNFIPEDATKVIAYYFIRIRTRFYIKDGKLPFIQIKNSFMYSGNECLESSDVYDTSTQTYHKEIYDYDGKKIDTRVTLTLTMTDWELLQEHYNLVDCEILDGCYFKAKTGIFDEYMEKYKQIKMTSKGAKRELAKLFLNNLYGKMASSKNSSFKLAYVKPDGVIGFYVIPDASKQAGYIAVGAAITSYARNFTIRAAQANYHGKKSRGFIYADTDSIHCDLFPDELQGIKTDDVKFCCWKLESCWDFATFTRQKTYIEHVTQENLKPCEPYYNVKCAGMPERSKKLFIQSMTQQITDDLTEEEKEFVKQKRTIIDFQKGLKVPGKLLPKRILGGIILKDTTYEMR